MYSNTPVVHLRSVTEFRLLEQGEAAPPPPSGNFLLTEGGFYLLLEDGSKIVLES
jgi:hypothetical protein